MPVNAGPEYFVAERKYLNAKTREEKIAALEEMIKTLPKHKGSSHLLSELRHRLAKLKKETPRKAGSKPKFQIRKEGAAQVCIVGITKSGKSTLLNSLTNARVEVADYPFTTKLPQVGMMEVNDVQVQMIEIPSTFDTEFNHLISSSDLVICLIDENKNESEQKDFLMKNLDGRVDQNKILFVSRKTNFSDIKEEIWKKLNLIRIYTKSPGKEKDLPAIAFSPGATVKDVAEKIHKDFLKTFKFARIFNKLKDSGKKVGLEYEIHDEDIVEIHTG